MVSSLFRKKQFSNMISSFVIIVWVLFVFTAKSSSATDNTIETSMRFPRHKHLREDDWKEFSHLHPRLKRWEKENNSVEHDPVNMEEHQIRVKDATGNKDLNVSYALFNTYLHRRMLTLEKCICRLIRHILNW